MPKKRAKQRSSAPRYGRTSRYDAVRNTPDLLDTYHPPVQRGLPLGPSRSNPLRHISEYLKYQRKAKPLETSFKKDRPYYSHLDDYAWMRESRRLAECERRKARREVLHARGHAGSKKRYKDRKSPGPVLDCKKSRH